MFCSNVYIFVVFEFNVIEMNCMKSCLRIEFVYFINIYVNVLLDGNYMLFGCLIFNEMWVFN